MSAPSLGASTSSGLHSSPIRLGAAVGRWSASTIVSRLRDLAAVVDAATIIPDPSNMPFSRSVLSDIRAAAQELQLTMLVHGPIWEFHTASVYPRVRALGVQLIERAIDFACEIGAVHVTLHPGPNLWHGPFPQLEWAALKAQEESFREIVQYAHQVDMDLGLENMPPGPGCLPGYDDLSELQRLLDVLPSVNVTLDIGHLHIAQQDVRESILKIGRRIGHVHVHDNFGQSDDHLAIGDGDINWNAVVETLVEIGYERFVEIECYDGVEATWRSAHRLERLVEAIPKSASHNYGAGM